MLSIREENAHKYQHLMELMEFAFALQRSVEDFNQSLIEFDLVLRCLHLHMQCENTNHKQNIAKGTTEPRH